MEEEKHEWLESDECTPTDTIVKAMEHAEKMEEVMVIFRWADDDSGGIGWFSNIDDSLGRVGLLEETKFIHMLNEFRVGEA